MMTREHITQQRHIVNTAYEREGFHSDRYKLEFDLLHDMNMQLMAEQFREERDLPPHVKTPYCL